MNFRLSFFLAVVLIFVYSCSENDSTSPVKLPDYSVLKDIEVGRQPAKVYFDSEKNQFHVFCIGLDKNFNQQKDEGDENPSWWIIDAANLDSAEKAKDFEFGYMGFPLRPFVDWTERKIYTLWNENAIRVYDLDNYQMISEIETEYRITAISKKGDLLYLSVSPLFGEQGEVVVVRVGSGEELFSFDAHINVHQTEHFEFDGEDYLAIIGVGVGKDDGSIQFAKIVGDSLSLVEEYTALGDLANHFYAGESKGALVLNGSHQVSIFDFNDFAVANTIPTLTDGFNGPREAVIKGDNVFVTTYNADLRIFGVVSGNLKQTIELPGKGEGFAFDDNGNIAVCNINMANSYDAYNYVSIIALE